MQNKKYHIKLTLEERKELGAVVRKRNVAAARVQRARVILAVDIGPEGPGLTSILCGETAYPSAILTSKSV